MKSILVMGGTTFVSSCVAKYLIKQGYDVDILTRGIKSIDYNGFREHIICDRKSKEDMERALKNRKYEFIFDITAYTKEDVEILLMSVDKSSLKKYIFCSSGAVYKPSNNIIDESFEKGENHNWGKYGLDKKESEELVINSGIPYMSFRPTYIYGENNNLYRETYFFDRIKSNKTIPIPYGNNTKTQFIHIDDLVRIFESAMNSEHINKIYNVTNPDVISWENYIITCGKVMGINPIMKKIDTREITLEVRMYFPFRDVTYMLSINQLIKDNLHVPAISLEEGLKKTYEWYLNQKPNLSDSRMNKVDEVVNN